MPYLSFLTLSIKHCIVFTIFNNNIAQREAKVTEIKNHPSTVEFGKVECCALRSAVKDVANQEFICGFIEKAHKKEPQHSWSILKKIFTNTIRLVFIPRTIHRDFYFNLACLEKKQLMEGNKTLACDHTIEEHINALDNIYFLMMCPAGKN